MLRAVGEQQIGASGYILSTDHLCVCVCVCVCVCERERDVENQFEAERVYFKLVFVLFCQECKWVCVDLYLCCVQFCLCVDDVRLLEG